MRGRDERHWLFRLHRTVRHVQQWGSRRTEPRSTFLIDLRSKGATIQATLKMRLSASILMQVGPSTSAGHKLDTNRKKLG